MSKTRTVKARCRCGHVLTVTEGPHGWKAVCPSCKAVVRVRAGQAKSAPTKRQDRVAVTCICGHEFTVSSQHVGRKVKCPTCGDKFDVPPPGQAWLDMYRTREIEGTDEIPIT